MVGAGCLLLLLFCALRAQAAVERLTIGGYPTLDLTQMHDPADPADPSTWAWDSESKTLTLEGYSGREIAFYSSTGLDTITLVFAGQNAIQNEDGHGLFANCNLVLRAATYSTQDKLTCRGGGSLGAGILAMSGMEGKLTFDSGTVAAFGAFPEGAQGAGGVGIQAQQVEIQTTARVTARGGDGQMAGGNGLYATSLLELTGRGARLDALGGHSDGIAGDGVVCAGGGMHSENCVIYTTGGDGPQPGNGLRHTAGHTFAVESGYLTAMPGTPASSVATGHGLTTGGDFRVSGGTHLITGGIQTPVRGLVISGGSLRTAAADIVDAEGHMVLPTDVLGNEVYLTRPAVSGGAWANIDTIHFRRDPPGGYHTDGLVANAVGRLFLWLPAGTAISGVASGLSEHVIEPALVTSQDHGARGNIYAATSEDGELLALAQDDGPLTVMGDQDPTTGQLTQPATATPQLSATPQPVQAAQAGTSGSVQSRGTGSTGSGTGDGNTRNENRGSVSNGEASSTLSGGDATSGLSLPLSSAAAGQALAQSGATGQQLAAAGSGTVAAAGSGSVAGASGGVAAAANAGTAGAASATGSGGSSDGKEEIIVPPTGDDGHMQIYLLLLCGALAALGWNATERIRRSRKDSA